MVLIVFGILNGNLVSQLDAGIILMNLPVLLMIAIGIMAGAMKEDAGMLVQQMNVAL